MHSPTKTREHAEGHNEAAADRHGEGRDEATAAADEGRSEATAAAANKKLDREDILRSQNNKNCTSEEDEEIIAFIGERRKIKKEDEERLGEASKKIKTCINTRKDPEHKKGANAYWKNSKASRTSQTSNQRGKGHSSQR